MGKTGRSPRPVALLPRLVWNTVSVLSSSWHLGRDRMPGACLLLPPEPPRVPAHPCAVTSSTSPGSTWPQGACGHLSQATSLPCSEPLCGSTSLGERTELSLWPTSPYVTYPHHPASSALTTSSASPPGDIFLDSFLLPGVHVVPSPLPT